MKISLVIPVFNEEEAIPFFYNAIRSDNFLSKHEVELIFINDGSKDKTSSIIENLLNKDYLVKLIDFSRNFGKESAMFCGLEYSTGDIVIPIDVDLQDPINVIPKMIEKYKSGVDIVLAKRIDRSSDSFFKRFSANFFYKIHNKISNPKIEENVGDFRLISRQAVEEIIKLPERQLFMKGILSWVGFKTEIVEYKREERIAGKTKFNGWKLWNFALEGFTSFSTLPLRIWTYIGFLVSVIAFIFSIIIIFKKIFWGDPVSGYASTMVAILFIGGIQLVGIGVLGEYIGRIYMETKQRPKYIIKKFLNKDNKIV